MASAQILPKTFPAKLSLLIYCIKVSRQNSHYSKVSRQLRMLKIRFCCKKYSGIINMREKEIDKDSERVKEIE